MIKKSLKSALTASFFCLAFLFLLIPVHFVFGNVYSASDDNTVKKIDSSGNEVWTFTGHTADVVGVSVDSEGNVYSASEDGTVKKIDSSGNEVWTFSRNPFFDVDVDSEGNVYSTPGSDIVKIDSSGNEVWTFSGHTGTVTSLSVDSNGNVYSGSYDDTVKKIDSSGNEVWTFTGHAHPVYDVDVDSEGNVYSAGNGALLKKIDSSGNEVWTFNDDNVIQSIDVDSEGNVYSGTHSSVKKIDSSGNVVWNFTGYNNAVMAIDVDSEGNVYSGYYDGIIKKIDSSGNEVWTFSGHTNTVSALDSFFSVTEYPAEVEILDFSLSRVEFITRNLESSDDSVNTVFGEMYLRTYDSTDSMVQEVKLPDFDYPSGVSVLEEFNLQALGFDWSQYSSGQYILEVEVLPFFGTSLTDTQAFSVGDYVDLPVQVSSQITGFNELSTTSNLSFDVSFTGVDTTYPAEVYLSIDGETFEVDNFSLSADDSFSYSEDISDYLTIGSAESKVVVVLYDSDGVPYSFSSDSYTVEHSGSFSGQFPELGGAFNVIQDGAMSVLRGFKSTFLYFFDNLKAQFPFNFFYSGLDAFNSAYEDFQNMKTPEYPSLVISWSFLNNDYSVNLFPMERIMTGGTLYQSDFNPATLFSIMRGLASASLIFTFILYIFKMIPSRVMKISNKSSE